MTVAKIFKRCPCPEGQWGACPHQWVVRYRTTGGRSSRQHEQSFGADLREAEDFALKVEHDKRAHVFVDPKAGRVLFSDAAGTWLDQHLGADSSIATYRSVLRAHIDPAFGGKPIGTIRREDIKALIAAMHRKGLSASRIGCAHLVVCGPRSGPRCAGCRPAAPGSAAAARTRTAAAPDEPNCK
jgi:integrase-like protein